MRAASRSRSRFGTTDPPSPDLPQGTSSAQVEALAHLRLATGIAGLEVALVLPAEHDVVVGGLRLHYLDWGSARKPPLLFLHGGCLTSHTWDLVCLALRKEFRCLALDLRGHGDSEWSPTVDYGPDAHVRDIRGLIEQLDLDRPVLIGQSLGGLNAMSYAAQAAHRRRPDVALCPR
jgi:esterase